MDAGAERKDSGHADGSMATSIETVMSQIRYFPAGLPHPGRHLAGVCCDPQRSEACGVVGYAANGRQVA